MTTFVIILHVLACLCLIFIVLLQTGKGSEMGAIFGSASSSVFGPTGPTTILTKITIGAAIVFMLTSLYLTYTFSRPLSNTLVPKSKTPTQTQQQQNQPVQQPEKQPAK
jgi:preprotein translocase subunit SecG